MTERESKNFKCPLQACQSLTQGQLSTAGACRSSYAGEWYRSTIALEASFCYKGFKVFFSPADDCTKEAGWGKCRYCNTTLCKVAPRQCWEPHPGHPPENWGTREPLLVPDPAPTPVLWGLPQNPMILFKTHIKLEQHQLSALN